MKFKLKKHQKRTIKYLIKNKYVICSLGMRLGKSICSLETWRRTGGRLLIVCPASLTGNWEEEVRKWYGRKYVISTFTEGKQIYKPFDTDIAIISFDLAQKAECLFEWADTVIGDEIHLLAAMEALRTEYFHRVVFENSIKRLILLSGTPVLNRVKDYYSLITLCHYNPEVKTSKFLKKYPDNVAFADHFSRRIEFKMKVGHKRFKIITWSGHRNVPELKKILEGIYIRIPTDAVITGVETIEEDVLMSKASDKRLALEFEKLKKVFKASEELSINAPIKAASALNKVPFTVQFVQDTMKRFEQCVIYTDHVESCEALAKAFEVPPITGKISAKKRLAIAAEFRAGKWPVIVATYKSFSTGVDLSVADVLVTNDRPWEPGSLDQAIYRIKHLDSKGKKFVYHIQGSPEDAKIDRKIRGKKKTIKAVVEK